MNSPVNAPADRVPELVRRLYSLVAELEALFPGRKFTPDGHLVGSIGEAIAAHRYELTLHRASSEAHAGTARDGKLVEIKATQVQTVALRAEPHHLIVLHLNKLAQAKEVFNGLGALVWPNCGAMQKNGQRPISLSTLRKLMDHVPTSQQLPARA